QRSPPCGDARTNGTRAWAHRLTTAAPGERHNAARAPGLRHRAPAPATRHRRAPSEARTLAAPATGGGRAGPAVRGQSAAPIRAQAPSRGVYPPAPTTAPTHWSAHHAVAPERPCAPAPGTA